MTANKRVFFRDFFTYFKSPAVFDQNQPNLIHAQRGAGNRALMHTIASGLDYVDHAEPVLVDPLLLPAHQSRRVRSGRACRRWA